MTMYSAYDLDVPPTRAMFGFDLFHLVTFRRWLTALDVAFLPRWLLALEINFTRRGQLVAGRVLGRGIYGEVQAKGSARRWDITRDEDGHMYFSMGRLWVVVDPKQGIAAAKAAQ